MNEELIKQIAIEEGITVLQVKNTLKLLEEGNTIPFIARYRKEATKGLDEVKIKSIETVYTYQVNLLKRKEDVIRLIEEKDMMTDELKDKIMKCTKLVEIEDLYRPYKEKKKTKATTAIANGLEGLAKIILSFPPLKTPEQLAESYKCKIEGIDEKLEGASYIISEYISDNASFRKYIRNFILKTGILETKLKKGKEEKDEDKTYEMYYSYEEQIKHIKPHRILAINRGEKEGVLSVKINIKTEEIESFLKSKIIKNPKSLVCPLVENSIKIV